MTGLSDMGRRAWRSILNLPMICRFMAIPAISIVFAGSLAIAIADLRQDSLGRLAAMQSEMQGQVLKVVRLGTRFSEAHANIYDLLIDAPQRKGERALYKAARPNLDALHLIEEELRQEIDSFETDPEIRQECTLLLQLLETNRVTSTNAILMATVDLELAAAQAREATLQYNEANRQFLKVEELFQERLSARLSVVYDEIDRKSKRLGLTFVGVFVISIVASIFLIQRMLRDLRSSVLRLSHVAQAGSAEAPLTDNMNEIRLLDRAIDDAQRNFDALSEARGSLATANAALQQRNAEIERREEAVSRLNAQLTEKVAQLNAAVAEREQAESALSRAQRMEAIGNLTGGMAHDFNNLLATILGNLELIREEEEAESRTPRIDAMIDAVLRGGDLTKSMLAFARRASLKPSVLDINAIVLETKNWAGRTFPANIQVETSLLAGLWAVEADASATESALLNLMLNARDAMPDGGRLTIETANVRIDEEYVESRREDMGPGRYVMLAVSDTGHGVPDDIVEKIFDPFFTTKPPGAGSGLGLSMIQGFMKQSGGTVRIYTEQHVGTTVKLYFKAVTDAGVDNRSSYGQGDEIAEAGARTLVVEDEPGVLNVLVATLSNAGYAIRSAPSGDAAYEIFKQDPTFDVLLTDIVMPGALQGTTLAKALREIRPDLPVVFMSGYASEATVHGNGLRPEDIRLSKPVRRIDLINAIEKALATSRSAVDRTQR